MSTLTSCSAVSCTKTGTLNCAGCNSPGSTYCSKACQTQDWKNHKVHCASAQKSNCYLIRAAFSATPTSSTSSFGAYVESFHLNSYGTEWAERAELQRRLDWSVIDEVGKFYDRKGSDMWYYYVYGSDQSAGAESAVAKNDVAGLACGKTVFGDVVVIRSGPADSHDFAVKFTKGELVKDLEYYKTEDSRVIFAQRERNRFGRKMGVDLQGVPSINISL